ncbi:hypothetical protein T492DRAFT_850406 [Pavlovales sp. CCMP2436]|nr:hypothetical protein T492DRAFT_850406 [Pavlovales sp. CCMP2436]
MRSFPRVAWVAAAGDAIIPESRLGGRVRAMALNDDGSMIALARMAVVRVYGSAHSGIVDEVTMPGDVVALSYSPFDTPTVKVVTHLLDRYQIPDVKVMTHLHTSTPPLPGSMSTLWTPPYPPYRFRTSCTRAFCTTHSSRIVILHDSQPKGKLAALTQKRLTVFAGEPGQLRDVASIKLEHDLPLKKPLILDVASIKLEHDLPLKEEEARHGLRWSADGSMVAVATATHAVLVNTHTGEVVASKRRDTEAWCSFPPPPPLTVYPPSPHPYPHTQVVASKRRDTEAWFSVFRLREEFGPIAKGFGRAAFYRECDVKEKQLKNLMMQLGVVRVQLGELRVQLGELRVQLGELRVLARSNDIYI